MYIRKAFHLSEQRPLHMLHQISQNKRRQLVLNDHTRTIISGCYSAKKQKIQRSTKWLVFRLKVCDCACWLKFLTIIGVLYELRNAVKKVCKVVSGRKSSFLNKMNCKMM